MEQTTTEVFRSLDDWSRESTGGGCEALVRYYEDLRDGTHYHAMLTCDDGAAIPERGRPCMLGVYMDEYQLHVMDLLAFDPDDMRRYDLAVAHYVLHTVHILTDAPPDFDNAGTLQCDAAYARRANGAPLRLVAVPDDSLVPLDPGAPVRGPAWKQRARYRSELYFAQELGAWHAEKSRQSTT